MNRPYEEQIISDKSAIRTFYPDVDFEDLKWHRDHEDRVVTPLNENDWQYQEDNKLPQPLKGELFIPKGLWHRVIKGTTELKVMIEKGSSAVN